MLTIDKQGAIKNIIQKNGFHASSEAILQGGLPLKRQYSREHLLNEKDGEYQQQGYASPQRRQSETTASSSSSSMDVNGSQTCIQGEGDSAMANPFARDVETSKPFPLEGSSNSGLEFYMPTASTSSDGIQRLITAGSGQQGWWSSTPGPDLPLQFQSDAEMQNARYLDLYEGGFLGAVPLEMGTSGDMFSGMFFSNGGAQDESDSFGMRF